MCKLNKIKTGFNCKKEFQSMEDALQVKSNITLNIARATIDLRNIWYIAKCAVTIETKILNQINNMLKYPKSKNMTNCVEK